MIKKIVLSLIILLTSVSGMFAEEKAAAYDCIPNFGNRTLKLSFYKNLFLYYEESDLIENYLMYELYAVKSFDKRDEVLFQIGVFKKDEEDYLNSFVIYDAGVEGEKTVYEKEGLTKEWYWFLNGDTQSREPISFLLYPDGKLNYYDLAYSKEVPQTSFYAEKVYPVD